MARHSAKELSWRHAQRNATQRRNIGRSKQAEPKGRCRTAKKTDE
jgi:hypothetical protein